MTQPNNYDTVAGLLGGVALLIFFASPLIVVLLGVYLDTR